MKKLLLIVLLPFLTSCMAANIAANVADVAYSINSLKGKGYNEPETSNVKFEYFDNEKGTVIPPLKKYFRLTSTNNDFISFSASESNDTKDCFVGLKFYKNDLEKNIESLQQFIDWSKSSALNTSEQSIQLKANNGKLMVLSFNIDKETKQPLLTYSGKDCDLFSSTKYYAVSPDDVTKMIEEIKSWKSSSN